MGWSLAANNSVHSNLIRCKILPGVEAGWSANGRVGMREKHLVQRKEKVASWNDSVRKRGVICFCGEQETGSR